jgi:plasmid maintenance system antidote protein VapI
VKTDMGQTDVAKVLGIDNNRVNKILKGIKKEK